MHPKPAKETHDIRSMRKRMMFLRKDIIRIREDIKTSTDIKTRSSLVRQLNEEIREYRQLNRTMTGMRHAPGVFRREKRQ